MEILLILAGTIVLLAAIYAAWDAQKHRTDCARFNQQTLDRLDALERDMTKQHDQQQQILGKLNVAVAATNRIGRVGGPR